jgi:Uma2 family endonuclease
MALPNRSMLSVEEYIQLDEGSYETRYEYIDGHLRMLAGGTPNHAQIAANIIITLGGLLTGNSCNIYTSDVRVQLSESRYVYPDVTVSCDKRERGDSNMLLHPRLVVEVLSPSTEAYDRGEKLTYYRECSTIQEYMLVNTQRYLIEIFRRETSNLWTYHAFNLHEEMELASLDIRFAVTQIYRNVEIPSE